MKNIIKKLFKRSPVYKPGYVYEFSNDGVDGSWYQKKSAGVSVGSVTVDNCTALKYIDTDGYEWEYIRVVPKERRHIYGN